MLKYPHSRYQRIYVYHLEMPGVPEVDDPDYIGGWQEGPTAVLFFHRPKDQKVAGICKKCGCELVYQADLDYRDWETGRAITPFMVGGLSVAPVWEPGEFDISLDPSVIFGNGFHPTTRLCLEVMHQLICLEGLSVDRAYDLGCGTGLLGIAAAKMGVGKVVCVDENSLACEVAQANILRNGVADRVGVERLDLSRECPDTKGGDLVMANLYHELLATLLNNPDFGRARYYVISGFFADREEKLLEILPQERFRLLGRQQREKWGLWVLKTNQL